MKSELERLKAAQAGDRGALERLLVPFQTPLLNYLYRMLGDRHQAEDLLQETFVRVLRSLHGFRPPEGVDPGGGEGPSPLLARWVFTIATNLARDARRGRRRDPQPLADAEVEAPSPAEGSAEDGGLLIALDAAIRGLPETQREVLLLRIHSGLTFGRIAEILGCPLNTALGRMHYALNRLRRSLRPYMAMVQER
ncbi:MAG: sigma-70 family RNA polymerase sigma factor [Planctomycetes bacterium]|nr:sigma-70 family RNA polymerase sigma factor [Planctomycetota bacterium]